MTPEESKVLKDHLKAAAAILLNNTPKEELKSFNSIELAVREHLLNVGYNNQRNHQLRLQIIRS